MKLESLLQYLDEYLEVEDFPDYGFAHNGLQVEGARGGGARGGGRGRERGGDPAEPVNDNGTLYGIN